MNCLNLNQIIIEGKVSKIIDDNTFILEVSRPDTSYHFTVNYPTKDFAKKKLVRVVGKLTESDGKVAIKAEYAEK